MELCCVSCSSTRTCPVKIVSADILCKVIIFFSTYLSSVHPVNTKKKIYKFKYNNG